MITGSIASNLYGVPRMTFDADIVISTDLEKLRNFIEDIKGEFYVDLDTAKNALERRGMFNIIHYATGLKIDFIVKKEGLYYEEEFKRRKALTLLDKTLFFASAEDYILSKLLWAKMGSSEMQFHDAVGVAKVQGDNLDYEYLSKFADILGISGLLKILIKKAKESNQHQ